MTDSKAAAWEEHLDSLLQEALERGGTFTFRARGNSMRPLIRTGDILVVEPAEPQRLRIGDLVLYRRAPRSYVVHLLIKRLERDRQLLVTRGDNLRRPDRPVPIEAVRGRVVGIQRDGRRLSLDGRPYRALSWLFSFSPWALWHHPWLRRLGRYPWGWLGRILWNRRTQ